MKKLLSTIILSALCIIAGAQSFEGTFTQAKTLKISGKVIRSQGNITFTAPDQLAMIYTVPDGDYFIIDGDIIRMDLRGITLDVDTSNNKSVRQQRNALLYGISGRYQEIATEMDADCTVSVKGGAKHVVLKMRNPAPKAYTAMELDYTSDGRISRMVLEEFGGISTEYVLNL